MGTCASFVSKLSELEEQVLIISFTYWIFWTAKGMGAHWLDYFRAIRGLRKCRVGMVCYDLFRWTKTPGDLMEELQQWNRSPLLIWRETCARESMNRPSWRFVGVLERAVHINFFSGMILGWKS